MQRLAPELGRKTSAGLRISARITAAARLLGLITLGGCAMTGPDVKVLSESPTQIEYSAWCGTQQCISRQNVTRMAEQHCAENGKTAKLVDHAMEEEDIGRGERFVYKFSCVL